MNISNNFELRLNKSKIYSVGLIFKNSPVENCIPFKDFSNEYTQIFTQILTPILTQILTR